jgi:hypothetical protein
VIFPEEMIRMKPQKKTIIPLVLWLTVVILSVVSFNSLAAICDADTDGDIDAKDIYIIQVVNIGRHSSGPADPKDADRNGVITIKDANICKSRCTTPNCVKRNNKLPIAVNDTASTAVNRRITINVVANDPAIRMDGLHPLQCK